jgi:hypothetical protein
MTDRMTKNRQTVNQHQTQLLLKSKTTVPTYKFTFKNTKQTKKRSPKQGVPRKPRTSARSVKMTEQTQRRPITHANLVQDLCYEEPALSLTVYVKNFGDFFPVISHFEKQVD